MVQSPTAIGSSALSVVCFPRIICTRSRSTWRCSYRGGEGVAGIQSGRVGLPAGRSLVELVCPRKTVVVSIVVRMMTDRAKVCQSRCHYWRRHDRASRFRVVTVRNKQGISSVAGRRSVVFKTRDSDASPAGFRLSSRITHQIKQVGVSSSHNGSLAGEPEPSATGRRG